MGKTAGLLFAAAYVLLLVFPKMRAQIAFLAAAVFVAAGIVPISRLFSIIDWNVIFMIAGTMGLVSLFVASGMPALLADLIIERTPSVRWAVISLALFAGLISAFIDNVATVLMVAPIAISVARKQKIPPSASVIAVAVSSNLQGAATLVGDATSILLGSYARLDFFDFFFFQGKPGLFWVVQAGALIATVVLFLILRNNGKRVRRPKRTKVNDYFPSLLLISMVALLILVSFAPTKPKITNGLICVGLLGLGLLRQFRNTKDIKDVWDVLAAIDIFTLLLLAGVFVIVGGITEAGVIERIGALVVQAGQGNVFFVYTLLVWLSVLISGFVDNIPYVAAMLPVAQAASTALQADPNLFYFGLLIGATLGGNLTPIGASANITALGLLRREGVEVGAGEFMRLSVPFTLAGVFTGYFLIWLLWG